MSKKPIGLYSLQHKFNRQTEDLERLILTLSSMFSAEASKVYSPGQRFISEDPYIKARIQVHQYHTLTTLFPNMIWSSTFLSVYSIFEHCLNDLCNIIQKHNVLSIVPRDLQDKGIKRSETYLSKVAQISFPIGTKDWKAVLIANDIRNCLSHANGYLRDASNKAKIETIVAKDKRLTIEDYQLIISKKYVLDFLASTKVIVSSLTGIPSTFYKL